MIDEEGKVKVAPIAHRVKLWTNIGVRQGFPLTAKCVERLLGMHITSASSERNWSDWGHLYTKYRASMSLELGEKLIFIRANSKGGRSKGKASEEIAL